jgi:pimeloyl-ACP methyl ester carboxylesterase
MRTLFAFSSLGIVMLFCMPFFTQGLATAQTTTSVDEEESTVSEGENQQKPSLAASLLSKTAGGTQLWTDHLYRGEFRIQQNVLTGHWRLLDGNDVRRTWGTRADCEQALDDLQPKTALEKTPGESPKHVIVLLHGLMRTRHSMKPLEKKLIAEGYPDVIRFSYASSRSSIADHAAALRQVLENLPDETQFSFVGHSMGNIVVRHLISDLQRDKDPHGVLDRCRSMVMLGPPNQGAAIARRLAATGLYGILTGKGGLELGPDWEKFVQNLATPPFPFAIIAGDVSQNGIENPLLDGSGDLVVSLEEAKLEGAETFETVPVLHSFLMNDETANERTVKFIQSH